MNQLLYKLNNHTFLNMTNKSITIPDLLKIDFNVTELQLNNLSIDNTFKLLELFDGGAVFGLKNLTGNVNFDYQYVTDPPILADIGEFNLDLANFTTKINTTQYYDQYFSVDLNSVDLEIEPFDADFNGISDMSDVVSGLINWAGNIVRDRIVSIVKYVGPDKIENVINSITDNIPDEIPIPGYENLYIEGGIAGNFTIKDKAYVSIPMDVSLKNRSRISHASSPVIFNTVSY